MKFAPLLLLLAPVLQDGEATRGTARALPLNAGRGKLAEQARQYAFEEETFTWKLTPVRRRRLYSEHTLSFPSPRPSEIEKNDTVYAKYWRPRGEGPFPAFVVLHWLAGNFGALETFCTRLAEHDVATVMVWMPHYGPRRTDGRRMISTDIDETIANCLQASADARRAGHWLHQRPEIDPDRVGILGISLGSFIAAATAGLDDQFDMVIPIVGGGDLAATLMHDSREVRAVRRELIEQGFTVESLREKLRPIDPITWAPRVAKERILMINMEDDQVVPRACTDALWEAFDRPEIKWYPGGHYHVALQISNLLWDVVRFARPERWY